MCKQIARAFVILLLSLSAQAQSVAETVVMPTGAIFSGYWANSLNTSNPTGSVVFTDKSDQSQWLCFAEDQNASSPKLSVAHVVNGAVTVAHNVLTTWSTTDQHNACSIALDNNGFIHLTYDQHVSPLNYFKSVHPRDPWSWTGPLSMLGTNESSITFPLLFSNPANGEVYFTFQKGGGASADQYFYHYKLSTTTWEAAAGTGTGGAITAYNPTTPLPVFVDGLPQWDKSGNLWFSYMLGDDTTPFFGCGSPTHYGCGEYVLGWNGTSFIKIGGAAQTVPITLANFSPVYTINSGNEPGITILDSVSIDANNNLWKPWADTDGSGRLQVFVLGANVATGVVGTPIQLTSNSSVFSPPMGAGWLGPGSPPEPGDYIQSITAFSSGTCTWVTYADIYNWGNGQIAFKSCNNFASSTSSYITARFNPNQIIFPDQVRNYLDGSMSFLFMYSNDTQFRFSTLFSSSSADIGKIWLMTMEPGKLSFSGSMSISGGTSIQ